MLGFVNFSSSKDNCNADYTLETDARIVVYSPGLFGASSLPVPHSGVE